ncbi:MAG TPA: glyoxylate/hydroxypyruvate reductase A [Acidimicrobiia bacterium]|nr:glyoxylate/hydroxypyruvate reductase A [Acidimicrobiia bacterium]
MRSVVGISFSQLELASRWRAELADRLAGCVVEYADRLAPGDVDVLVVGNPPGSGLRRYSSLRFVQSTWAGVDQLVEGGPSVPIARMVAPALASLMAEFVHAAVLMVHRGFPEYRRRQSEHEWRPLPPVETSRRRVGVLGFGELGRPCAVALAAAGFDVAAWARRSRPAEVPVLVGTDGFSELLSRSEIVANLLPLTPATVGILDQRAFARMPRGSTLINVARGGHVVETDLLRALDGGHLSDAILDVFAEEPLPPEHAYWSHPRVTVLPHVAAPSDPEDLAPDVAANIERFLSGRRPRFLVSG